MVNPVMKSPLASRGPLVSTHENGDGSALTAAPPDLLAWPSVPPGCDLFKPRYLQAYGV